MNKTTKPQATQTPAEDMFRAGGANVYGAAHYVANNAWARASIPPNLRDEDAVQEAAAAFVEADGLPKSWAFRRAQWRVMSYLFSYYRGDNTHRPGAYARGEIERVSFVEDPEDTFRRLGSSTNDPEQILLNREDAAEREEMLEQAVRLFYHLLLDSRSKKGVRGKKAAAREANMLALRLAGYSNAGIAQELDIPERDVKHYLRQARQRLADSLNRMEAKGDHD